MRIRLGERSARGENQWKNFIVHNAMNSDISKRIFSRCYELRCIQSFRCYELSSPSEYFLLVLLNFLFLTYLDRWFSHDDMDGLEPEFDSASA